MYFKMVVKAPGLELEPIVAELDLTYNERCAYVLQCGVAGGFSSARSGRKEMVGVTATTWTTGRELDNRIHLGGEGDSRNRPDLRAARAGLTRGSPSRMSGAHMSRTARVHLVSRPHAMRVWLALAHLPSRRPCSRGSPCACITSGFPTG